MNGRYHVADTPSERLAVAVLAAQRKYENDFPNGVFPGQVFLEEFLQPFIERELIAARVDELHRIAENKIRARERELLDTLSIATRECEKRVNS